MNRSPLRRFRRHRVWANRGIRRRRILVRGARQRRKMLGDRAERQGREEREAANDHDRPHEQHDKQWSIGRHRPPFRIALRCIRLR